MHRRQRSTYFVGIAVLAALGLVGCASGGAGPDSDEKSQVRFSWWSNEVRDGNYLEAIDLFESEHPEIEIVPQYSAYDGYWEKFNTEVAGGNPVDLTVMTTNQLAIQANNGVVSELSDVSGLDLSEFGQEALDAGKVGDGVYGIDIGGNMHVWILNASVLDAAGVEAPSADWSWKDFEEFAQSISDATNGEMYGTSDHGGRYEVFETTLVGEGSGLFSDDGKSLGYTKDDLREWWQMWDDMRVSGAAAPADVTAGEDFSAENSAVLRAQTAGAFIFSTMYEGWQAATDDELILLPVPGGLTYNKVSQYLSLVSSGKNPEGAAVFMNWLINNEEAGRILGVERGVPVQPKVRDAILPDLDGPAKRVVEFMVQLDEDGLVGPTPRLQPAGADEINTDLFKRTYEQISFGAMTVDQAVDAFFTEATAILERNQG